jgi:hypothetical protein
VKLLIVCLALAACGDNTKPATADGGKDTMADAAQPLTLTTYVIDLIEHHTSETEAAHPMSEFQVLPDPDGDANNTSAYSALF